MWDDAFKDAQESIGQSESFDNLADFVESHAAECFSPLSAVHAEHLGPSYRSSLEALQDSVAEQMAQLQEAVAEIANATACDATDRIGALGVLPEIQEAAHTALSDHIESLKGPIAGDLELVSASELVRLQPGLICGAGAFAQESPLAAVQAMLKELELDTPLLSNSVLGITGLDDLTSISGISNALPDTGFVDSYLDDLQDSIRDLYAELSEQLISCTPSTAFPEPAQLPTWREYTSALGVAPNVDHEKLGARHGTQFTVRQALTFEAVARTAQRLLSI